MLDIAYALAMVYTDNPFRTQFAIYYVSLEKGRHLINVGAGYAAGACLGAMANAVFDSERFLELCGLAGVVFAFTKELPFRPEEPPKMTENLQ